MELVDFELAFKEAVSAHKKVGWVSVFDKTIHFFKSFIFEAKAFSFCLFYCHPALVAGSPLSIRKGDSGTKAGMTMQKHFSLNVSKS
ncbi:hypothetical protein [Fibrobacter sp.]|uniref:hypothetical protein n=1 Tax=Fibrobacter sp. TaxID=35828 RepID=UPI003866A385